MSEATSTPRKTGILPHWARATHPIFRRELQRWDRARRWKWLRAGCAPLALLFFIGIALLCNMSTIGIRRLSPQETLLEWGAGFLFTLLVAQAFIVLVTGLISTVLTATTISSEIESETYSLMRVTELPSREIALAKYAAAVYQLRTALLVIIGTRLALVVGGLVALDLAMRTPDVGMNGLLPALIDLTRDASTLTMLLILLVGLVVWVVYLVIMPVLLMLLYAAIGLYASSMTRTRTSGIITAVGLRVAFAVALVVINQLLSVGLTYVSLVRPDVLDSLGTWINGLLVDQPVLFLVYLLATLILTLTWNVGWRSGLTSLLVRASARRMRSLPYS